MKNNLDKYKLGQELHSLYLANGSFTKYKSFNEDNEDAIYLKTFKVFYLRNTHVKAIQLIFSDDIKNQDLYTSPKIYGFTDQIIDTTKDNKELNIIDEYSLHLEKHEFIIKISGCFNKDSIKTMQIETSLGQVLDLNYNNNSYLSQKKTEKNYNNKDNNEVSYKDDNAKYNNPKNNFKFEYITNYKLFNGLLVGWNEDKINYIEFLCKEITELPGIFSTKQNEIKDNSLLDNEFVDFIQPIYKSKVLGNYNNKTVIEDDYEYFTNRTYNENYVNDKIDDKDLSKDKNGVMISENSGSYVNRNRTNTISISTKNNINSISSNDNSNNNTENLNKINKINSTNPIDTICITTVVVYYSNNINCIEIVYYDKIKNEYFKCIHTGSKCKYLNYSKLFSFKFILL